MNRLLDEEARFGEEVSAFIASDAGPGECESERCEAHQKPNAKNKLRKYIIGFVFLIVPAVFAVFSLSPRKTMEDIDDPWDVIQETAQATLLSHTWRIDSSMPFLLKPGRVIFDEREGDINEVQFNTMDACVISASSTVEFASKFSSSVGISGSYFAFSGAAQASLESVSSEKHKMFRSTNSIKYRHRQLSSQVFDPISRLTPGSKKFLLKSPVHTIHDRMGDFFATEVMLGGVYQIQTVTAMFESESEAAVQADMEVSYDAVAASADASFSVGATSTAKSTKHSYKSRVKALGGDTSKWLRLDGGNRKDIQTQWADSVTDENEFPVSFALVPIWHLLDSDDMDIAKARELKNFMVNRWGEAELPQFPGVKEGIDDSADPMALIKGTYHIKTHHGRWLQVWSDNTVNAKTFNADKPGAWEEFTFYHVRGNTYRLKTHHGRWLQVWDDNTVNANSDNPGAFEEFTFYHVSGNTYRIKTHHGNWLQVWSDNTLNARSDNPGAWEEFTLEQA